MTDQQNDIKPQPVKVGSGWEKETERGTSFVSLQIDAEISGSVRCFLLRNRDVEGNQPTHRLMAYLDQPNGTIAPDESWKQRQTNQPPLSQQNRNADAKSDVLDDAIPF